MVSHRRILKYESSKEIVGELLNEWENKLSKLLKEWNAYNHAYTYLGGHGFGTKIPVQLNVKDLSLKRNQIDPKYLLTFKRFNVTKMEVESTHQKP